MRALCSIHPALCALARASVFLLLGSLLVGCVGYTESSNAPKGSPETPSLTLSSNSVSFSTVVVGQTESQTLTIGNQGNAPLRLTALSVSNPQFSVSGPSIPATILPSASLAFSIAFSPASAGADSATLNISSNAANGIVALPLSGTGEKAFANLVISPASINFGNLNLKATGTQKVMLENSGDASMTIQGITVAGAGFGYANLTPGFSLAPNQSVTFQAWFTPQVSGPASATLSFISSSLSAPATLSLTGDGVAAPAPAPAPPPTPAVQHKVDLSWNASSGAAGYRVYRSQTPGGSYTPLTGAPFSALTYTDSTVTSGKTYYYVVTSFDAAGVESAYSNQVAAVIPDP